MPALTPRPTLIIQMVLVCYTFLCFSSMTEMNVAPPAWLDRSTPSHLYCFIILPNSTQTHFLNNFRLVIFYLLWLVYLWLSVLQIRHG